MEKPPWGGFNEVLAVFTGLAGGATKLCRDWLRQRLSKNPDTDWQRAWSWPRVLVELLLSGLVALPFYFIASKISPEMVPIACWLGGALGTRGVDYIEERFTPFGETAKQKKPHDRSK